MRLYARFEGRASRSEFWPFSLAAWAVEAVVMMFVPRLGGLVILALMPPLLGLLVRRLHDTNRMAWWLLPPPLLIPPLALLFACTQFTLGDEAGRKIFTGIGVILAILLVYTICLISVLERFLTYLNRLGFPWAWFSDSGSMLVLEASMDGTSIVGGSSG